MTTHDFDLVVLGSGPAGQRAAIQAAKIGRRVALVERMPSLGGVCILTGTIPSKTFREAVLATVGSDAFGLTSESTPRPSMSDVLSRVQEVMISETRVIKNQLLRNNVEIIQGSGRFSGTHEISVLGRKGTQTLTADNILISVGTRPADPPDIPVDGTVILTSDEILAMEKIPSSMAIVGGGVIGLEYASMFARLGVEVHVVDRHHRLLEFVDHEIVDELISQMRNNGIRIHLDDSIKHTQVIGGDSPHAEIKLDSGEQILTETVLFSIGRIASTGSLNLKAIGLEPGRRGLLEVDENFRTAVPHVWAAGDVIGFPALAATSSEQGRIAACRMFGIDTPDMGQSYPYGIYSIPEISMVGATEEKLNQAGTPFEVGLARYSEIARGQILGDDTGLFKMLFHKETGRLLGVHCIGTGATELVHVGQAVLKLGGGIDYFLETVFNYPTLAECYKVAAYNAANKMGYHHVTVESAGSLVDFETDPEN
ncbi:MAG: Si-specific NAD(P)(+) transhydrogenase [Phycisphaerales bacterium]|jgi:NAD(P) transhydrogenase|nr:Si-specific NAD(P)(+) transhydrogenase [Phycisphaerales bacterium]